MTKDEAIRKLVELQVENPDTEVVHEEADDILCQFLTSLGYQDVVLEWSKVDKWYA